MSKETQKDRLLRQMEYVSKWLAIEGPKLAETRHGLATQEDGFDLEIRLGLGQMPEVYMTKTAFLLERVDISTADSVRAKPARPL